MMAELKRFLLTFGIIIIMFLVFGRVTIQSIMVEMPSEPAKYWAMLLDLFVVINGKPDFELFTVPFGQVFIGSFLLIFKILLLALLAAMFVNKYNICFENLDSFKRFSIIKMKNFSRYDPLLGAISLTFFPINIIVAPLIVPIILLQSKRASDFFLKMQYSLMMVLYSLAAILAIVLLIPVLVIKVISNSVYILIKNKRQKYQGENCLQFLMALFLSPLIIPVSIVVDLISMPNILFKDADSFEHKYQLTDNPLNSEQVIVVMELFDKLFNGQSYLKYKDKQFSLIQLMKMHRKTFDLVANLHDLTCKGIKDYKVALARV